MAKPGSSHLLNSIDRALLTKTLPQLEKEARDRNTQWKINNLASKVFRLGRRQDEALREDIDVEKYNFLYQKGRELAQDELTAVNKDYANAARRDLDSSELKKAYELQESTEVSIEQNDFESSLADKKQQTIWGRLKQLSVSCVKTIKLLLTNTYVKKIPSFLSYLAVMVLSALYFIAVRREGAKLLQTYTTIKPWAVYLSTFAMGYIVAVMTWRAGNWLRRYIGLHQNDTTESKKTKKSENKSASINNPVKHYHGYITDIFYSKKKMRVCIPFGKEKVTKILRYAYPGKRMDQSGEYIDANFKDCATSAIVKFEDKQRPVNIDVDTSKREYTVSLMLP